MEICLPCSYDNFEHTLQYSIKLFLNLVKHLLLHRRLDGRSNTINSIETPLKIDVVPGTCAFTSFFKHDVSDAPGWL